MWGGFWPAAHRLQRLGGGVGPLGGADLLKSAHAVDHRDTPEVEALAAREDRRADLVALGRRQSIQEEGSELASLLFQRLVVDPPANLYVPDLFYAECANVLWKYVRQYDYAAEAARQNLSDLGALALQAVPTASLVQPALTLALEYDVTVYDACYLALAQLAGVPLVTADVALVNKMQGAGIEVCAL